MRMTSKNYSLFLIITVIQLRGLISSCSNLEWAFGTLSPSGRYPRLGPGVTWRGMPTRLCQALWRTLLLGEEEKLHTIFGTSRSRAFLRRCCFPSSPPLLPPFAALFSINSSRLLYNPCNNREKGQARHYSS